MHIGKQNVNTRIHLPYTSYYTHLMQVFPLAPSSPYSIAYSFPSSLSIIHAILKILFSRPPTNDRTCLEMEKSIGRESARKQSCRAPFLYARLIRRLTLTRLQPSFFFFWRFSFAQKANEPPSNPAWRLLFFIQGIKDRSIITWESVRRTAANSYNCHLRTLLLPRENIVHTEKTQQKTTCIDRTTRTLIAVPM